MRYQSTAQAVETFGVQAERKMSIHASGKAFDTLMSRLYSNKISSIVREAITNAWDSHIAAKRADVQFKVHSPDHFEPWFSVRDYGVSMDHDFVMELYSMLFWSSKEGNNEEAGCFGLGSKAPFAYVNEFGLTTWAGDGMQRTYACVRTESGEPSVLLMEEMPSDEPRGVMVSFPVKQHDIDAFERAIAAAALPLPTTFICNIDVERAALKQEFADFAFLDRSRTTVRGPYVQIGPVWYPIDFTNDEFRRVVGDQNCSIFSGANDLILRLPIGKVEVTPSRETISYTTTTCEAIKAGFQKVTAFVHERLAQVIANDKDIWTAAQTFHEFKKHSNHLEQSLFNVMKSPWGFYVQLAVCSIPGQARAFVLPFSKRVGGDGVSRLVEKRKGTDSLGRDKGTFVVLVDDMRPRPKLLHSRIIAMMAQTGLGGCGAEDGYIFRLPDPKGEVTRRAEALRKAPVPPDAGPDTLWTLHQERRRKLKDVYRDLVEVRKRLLALQANYGCPDVIDMDDLPTVESASSGKTRSTVVYEPIEHRRHRQTADWETSPDLRDKPKNNWLVFPLTGQKFHAGRIPHALKGALKELGCHVTRVIGVAAGSYNRFMLNNPEAIGYDSVMNVDLLDIEAMKQAITATATLTASDNNCVSKSSLARYQSLADFMGDSAPPELSNLLAAIGEEDAFKNKARAVAGKNKLDLGALGFIIACVEGERFKPTIEETKPAEATYVHLQETYPNLSDVMEGFQGETSRIHMGAAHILGMQALNQLVMKRFHEGQEL